MLTVFISDIFGQSEALKSLAQAISDEFIIIAPYSGQSITFANEQEAYHYFTKQIGLDDYAQQVKTQLAKIKQPINIIAFSVGGAALWLNAEQLKQSQVNQVVCFYPSQIRHHLTIQPQVAMTLVLPICEKHFDIDEMAKRLAKTNLVTLEKSVYQHGFMNQLSNNFNLQGYKKYCHILQKTLAKNE
ncbi:hypothetical protein CW745_13035 [Psychromonas sp. psych-6C06]|uniref:dienelactone hydrolase family protein n=1 Tax=Psychromonas sp. psych-6C06 TaxID=2058089 RepID=UPI000C31DFB8|nr:dienelactone hydrolase family protein [Psychromonas sp. psych-6C06]PKF60793.1 hypothetical protein CW745_13035 [Psychromonas sp. psych-6C06]